MASSYKFCVIATGEYDIYAAKKGLMNGTMQLDMDCSKCGSNN